MPNLKGLPAILADEKTHPFRAPLQAEKPHLPFLLVLVLVLDASPIGCFPRPLIIHYQSLVLRSEPRICPPLFVPLVLSVPFFPLWTVVWTVYPLLKP